MIPKEKIDRIDAAAARMYPTLRSIDDEIVPLAAMDVHDLALHKFKQREQLLTPWLHSQDLAMIFAGRGIGKTHLAFAISLTIATGGTFARWRAPKPAKVLYLDGELPGSVCQDRVEMHMTTLQPQPGYFRIFTPDLLPDGIALPDLSTAHGQDSINQMIETDTALIVIDNLSAWCRTGRENEAESWHPVADWILELRRRGLAVLMIHHAGKGGEQRGTSKREDLLDVVIKLNRPTDYDPRLGAVFNFEFTKARNLTGEDSQSLELALSSDKTDTLWTWRTAEAGSFERVVTLANEGFTQAEISIELGINKSNVSRHFKRAKADGRIKGAP